MSKMSDFRYGMDEETEVRCEKYVAWRQGPNFQEVNISHSNNTSPLHLAFQHSAQAFTKERY